MLEAMQAALRGDGGLASPPPRLIETGAFASAFATTPLLAASLGAAGAELAGWAIETDPPDVTVDARLASLASQQSILPVGWAMPSVWDVLAGDYRDADGGWIRLHTNAAAHRLAALTALGLPPGADRQAVTLAVSRWRGEELEDAVFAAGGCAAWMRSAADWLAHPQGAAVAREPLIDWRPVPSAGALGVDAPHAAATPERPLAGVRVLDLTRIIAGPVGTRLLAGWGAQVLRIDPPGWDEPTLVPEVTAGKRCARLDLRSVAGRATFESLLGQADVLVHGLRPDALEGLGLGPGWRRERAPALVEITLDAWGWTGPWAARRGFDSLVQMASGIAQRGREVFGGERPHPLPSQALDHATGHLIAAAAIQGLRRRRADGQGWGARLSLARTARLLVDSGVGDVHSVHRPAEDDDFALEIEHCAWGDQRRMRSAVRVAGCDLRFDTPAVPLGSSPPAWPR